MTSTRSRNEEIKRVQDGLIISEFGFLNNPKSNLLPETKNISFTRNGALMEDLIYSDSRVLPEATTVIDHEKVETSLDSTLLEESVLYFG